MDAGPPPFVPPSEVDDEASSTTWSAVASESEDESLARLKLPLSRSRSASPCKANGLPEVSEEVHSEAAAFNTSKPHQNGFCGGASENADGIEESAEDVQGKNTATASDKNITGDNEFGDFEETMSQGPVFEATPEPSSIAGLEGQRAKGGEEFKETENSQKNENEEIDEEDEWAEFQTSNTTSAQEKESSTGGKDWAAFDASESREEEDDEWGAEFSSSAPPVTTPQLQPVVPSLPSLDALAKDSCIWDLSEEDELSECAVDLAGTLDEEEPLKGHRSGFEEELRTPATLWLALRVVEDASALTQTWTGSAMSQILFKLLDIDTTLPTSGVLSAPLSAPLPLCDAVLQPLPVSATTARDCNGKGAVPTQPARVVTLTTSGNSISHVVRPCGAGSAAEMETNPTSTNCLSPTPLQPSTSSEKTVLPSSALIDSLRVPPANFDWEKSGLTNPLTSQALNASSAILDVDYLAGGAPSLAPSPADTLQKDLDAFGLSATSASARPTALNTPSLLDSLLSGGSREGTSDGKECRRQFRAPSELSLDARALHDALPNIDYMKASWIVFPLRGAQGESPQAADK